MPHFAANLGYLFTERALLERIDAAAACGFKGVELQFPYDVPAAQVKAAIARNKLTVLGVNTPPGEREGEFGLAAVPGREKDWQVVQMRDQSNGREPVVQIGDCPECGGVLLRTREQETTRNRHHSGCGATARQAKARSKAAGARLG